MDIDDAACTVAVYGPAVLFSKTQAQDALCGLDFIKPEDATPDCQYLMSTKDPSLPSKYIYIYIYIMWLELTCHSFGGCLCRAT